MPHQNATPSPSRHITSGCERVAPLCCTRKHTAHMPKRRPFSVLQDAIKPQPQEKHSPWWTWHCSHCDQTDACPPSIAAAITYISQSKSKEAEDHPHTIRHQHVRCKHTGTGCGTGKPPHTYCRNSTGCAGALCSRRHRQRDTTTYNDRMLGCMAGAT